ncbi:uncharacterized protein J3D65DRAFT_308457 [Phyllosticta citribraziliensis]|uniref:Uncharacterized protein n=1 Tax=Phyllosticta citribraziliensis TaxID=989973 RepID=A0ABR1LXZ2_9PEZI
MPVQPRPRPHTHPHTHTIMQRWRTGSPPHRGDDGCAEADELLASIDRARQTSAQVETQLAQLNRANADLRLQYKLQADEIAELERQLHDVQSLRREEEEDDGRRAVQTEGLPNDNICCLLHHGGRDGYGQQRDGIAQHETTPTEARFLDCFINLARQALTKAKVAERRYQSAVAKAITAVGNANAAYAPLASRTFGCAASSS